MKPVPGTVYILRTDIDRDEAPGEVYREFARGALSALDLEIPAAGHIMLKVNATLLVPPAKRITTHPEFVGGLLDALLERGAAPERLVVGDGQSGEDPEKGMTWESSGYTGAVSARGARLVEMNGVASRPVDVPGGEVYQSFPMAREVTDASLLLNVPVAKCHNLVCTTLCVKNLMGTVLSPQRHFCGVQEVDEPYEEGIWRLGENGLSRLEQRFCHKLCDLVTALRTLPMRRLCVIDGLVGRDGTGFNEGKNRPLGWTVMGDNEIHVDAMGTYLMGLDPEATPYLQLATARGLGTNRIEEIDLVDPLTGKSAEAASLRASEPFMPISSGPDGRYYDRFRADGSVVPWDLASVNNQRQEDGLEPVSAD